MGSRHFEKARLAVSAALRLWQRWHNPSGRLAALARLGMSPEQREVARSSRGAWSISANRVMQHALNNRVLKKHGFITQSDLAG